MMLELENENKIKDDKYEKQIEELQA